MKLIYVATPYRASTKERLTLHLDSAKIVAVNIAELGAYPVSPVLNTAYFDSYAPLIPDAFWLNGCIELMRRCDAVFVNQFSHASEGVAGEVLKAQQLGIPVLTNMTELMSFIDGDELYESEEPSKAKRFTFSSHQAHG